MSLSLSLLGKQCESSDSKSYILVAVGLRGARQNFAAIF